MMYWVSYAVRAVLIGTMLAPILFNPNQTDKYSGRLTSIMATRSAFLIPSDKKALPTLFARSFISLKDISSSLKKTKVFSPYFLAASSKSEPIDSIFLFSPLSRIGRGPRPGGLASGP